MEGCGIIATIYSLFRTNHIKKCVLASFNYCLCNLLKLNNYRKKSNFANDSLLNLICLVNVSVPDAIIPSEFTLQTFHLFN